MINIQLGISQDHVKNLILSDSHPAEVPRPSEFATQDILVRHHGVFLDVDESIRLGNDSVVHSDGNIHCETVKQTTPSFTLLHHSMSCEVMPLVINRPADNTKRCNSSLPVERQDTETVKQNNPVVKISMPSHVWRVKDRKIRQNKNLWRQAIATHPLGNMSENGSWYGYRVTFLPKEIVIDSVYFEKF